MADTARLIVPPLDPEPWPTLGPEVCDYIEASLVHGPGDLLGSPVTLSDELRLFIYRAYEVYPRGHDQEGRRRFKRVTLSRRKGVGKTEIAAWLAIAELDPDAPVRCDGWRVEAGEWVPVGRGIHDPYVPMVAVTEEQTEDLAYRGAYEIIVRAPISDRFDPALERIALRDAPGKITALASAPSARDGARTTFQHFDETHLWVSERLRRAQATMLRNIPKRYAADPWSLETTTMYGPGEGSVAEESHAYAQAVDRGEVKDPRLYFDHRQAREVWDIRKDDELREAIREASGDAYEWTDVEGVVALFNDPATDENEFRRYWLNQRRKSSRAWLPGTLVSDRVTDDPEPVDDTPVVLAFDGSYSRDSTALVGCTVDDEVPLVFVLDVWERPLREPSWRVSHLDVNAAVDAAMRRYRVLELAPDPFGWHADVEGWEEKYGEVVVRFETNRPLLFGPACSDFEQAVRDDAVRLRRSEPLVRHLSNAVPIERAGRTVITKSAPDSPEKIDVAVGAIVAFHRSRWHHIHRQKPRPKVRLIDLGE